MKKITLIIGIILWIGINSKAQKTFDIGKDELGVNSKVEFWGHWKDNKAVFGNSYSLKVINRKGKTCKNSDFSLISLTPNVTIKGSSFEVNPYVWKYISEEYPTTIKIKVKHKHSNQSVIKTFDINASFDNEIRIPNDGSEIKLALARYKTSFNQDLCVLMNINTNKLYILSLPLEIDASGIDGRDGNRGRSGRNGSNAGLDFSTKEYGDYKGPGGNGSDGSDGSDGENGGDSGNVLIYTSNTSNLKSYVTVDVSGGKGGRGGRGGYGGNGGSGDPKGKDGQRGRDGRNGNSGSAGNYKFENINYVVQYFVDKANATDVFELEKLINVDLHATNNIIESEAVKIDKPLINNSQYTLDETKSKLIITFDVDGNEAIRNVQVEISTKDGFGLSPKALIGDFGYVLPGKGKRIIWHADADGINIEELDLKVRVIAHD